MMCRNFSSLFGQFANQPVHLVVEKDRFSVSLTTDAIVKVRERSEISSCLIFAFAQEKLAARLNQPWQSLPFRPFNSTLSYDAMCSGAPSKCTSLGPLFGGKAAMLGFLVVALGRSNQVGTPSNKLGYDLVPYGFGIPLSCYKEFVKANSNLSTALDRLIGSDFLTLWCFFSLLKLDTKRSK